MNDFRTVRGFVRYWLWSRRVNRQPAHYCKLAPELRKRFNGTDQRGWDFWIDLSRKELAKAKETA